MILRSARGDTLPRSALSGDVLLRLIVCSAPPASPRGRGSLQPGGCSGHGHLPCPSSGSRGSLGPSAFHQGLLRQGGPPPRVSCWPPSCPWLSPPTLVCFPRCVVVIWHGPQDFPWIQIWWRSVELILLLHFIGPTNGSGQLLYPGDLGWGAGLSRSFSLLCG